MNKILIMTLASIGMFACSKENAPETQNQEKGVVFELATVNQLSEGPSVKSRPLYSQEAVQEVQKVDIYAFQKQGTDFVYTKTYTISDWTKGSTFKRFAVPADNELAEGDYNILVVGREATDNFTVTTPTLNTTKMEDMAATITAPGNESEIFAGTTAVTVSSEGARISVEMARKVAGVLLYLKNIPKELNNTVVTSFRLTVTNADTKMFLFNGTGAMPTNTPYTIFNVDLTGQAVSNGVYIGNDLSSQNVVKVDNSQLFGKFLLPVGAIKMNLGLYDASNNLVKGWTVMSGNTDTFNITANQLYTLGQKKVKGDITGGGTPDTGDDDAPIDLLLDQVVTITINPNWDVINDLTIK